MRRTSHRPSTCFPAVLALAAWTAAAAAQDFDQPPIRYSTTTANNAISELQGRLDSGRANLAFEDGQGFLRSVLNELNVPASSQTLVFSKTSLQRHCINPRTPRAVYFNDEVYVGYCQGGDVVEISAVDPSLGTVYYTLDQQPAARPAFVRQTDSCLLCHGSSYNQGVPGHLVRSVFADRAGLPILSSGSYRIDHTSPFEQRWGGWYVTGTHGDQKHLGNLIATNRDTLERLDNSAGLNVKELTERFDTSKYLTPHSDIVALMVLEHQAQGHNLIARANFLTRVALHHETQLNKELSKPVGHRWESTTSRLKDAAEPLVKYLLFHEEARLTDPVCGTCEFAEQFSAIGPRDALGRSLRQFDLNQRLF
ncbi:MAG: hypothetical protein WD176_01190, partial [Pirellulales bacterium]